MRADCSGVCRQNEGKGIVVDTENLEYALMGGDGHAVSDQLIDMESMLRMELEKVSNAINDLSANTARIASALERIEVNGIGTVSIGG